MRTVVSTILLVLGLSACLSADVATIRQNLDKYWFYRAKHRAEFQVPGAGQGRSMPAEWRNPGSATIK